MRFVRHTGMLRLLRTTVKYELNPFEWQTNLFLLDSRFCFIQRERVSECVLLLSRQVEWECLQQCVCVWLLLSLLVWIEQYAREACVVQCDDSLLRIVHTPFRVVHIFHPIRRRRTVKHTVSMSWFVVLDRAISTGVRVASESSSVTMNTIWAVLVGILSVVETRWCEHIFKKQFSGGFNAIGVSMKLH